MFGFTLYDIVKAGKIMQNGIKRRQDALETGVTWNNSKTTFWSTTCSFSSVEHWALCWSLLQFISIHIYVYVCPYSSLIKLSYFAISAPHPPPFPPDLCKYYSTG